MYYHSLERFTSVGHKTARFHIQQEMAPATRATTSRVAKARLKRLVKNGDDEVSFPRLEFNTSALSDGKLSDNTCAAPTLSPALSRYDHREGWVDRLEAQVKDVRSEVSSIHRKLDKLVDAATLRQGPMHHSTLPRSRAAPGRGGGERANQHEDSLPPPRQLRQEANRDGFVDYYSQCDRFNPPTTSGKTLDNAADTPIKKPYMYILREVCQTEKQKLEVRCDLSVLEYTNALVKLVLDIRAYHPDDHRHIMRHLRNVTHDAMERPWSAVRRWSQAVFDAIERGEFMWPD